MNEVTDLYPSRCGEEERILPRQDPVVHGDPQPEVPHTLTAEQLESYDRDGFIVLPDYMPEMVAPLLEEMENLRYSMQSREELYTEPDSNELRTIFKPYAFSELIDRFSRDPQILNIARQLLGSDVYIAQSRINVKPAYRGKSFPWHSDFETWHTEDGMPRMRAVTAWIMLNDNTEHNGPLYVIPGSHHEYVSCAGETAEKNYEQSLKKQTAGVPRPETMDCLLQNRSIRGVYGKAGTVVFHECNIMHGSPDNISNQPRRLLMFVYNSCENRPVEPFGGQAPRPEYLSSADRAPLKPSR